MVARASTGTWASVTPFMVSPQQHCWAARTSGRRFFSPHRDAHAGLRNATQSPGCQRLMPSDTSTGPDERIAWFLVRHVTSACGGFPQLKKPRTEHIRVAPSHTHVLELVPTALFAEVCGRLWPTWCSRPALWVEHPCPHLRTDGDSTHHAHYRSRYWPVATRGPRVDHTEMERGPRHVCPVESDQL
jgi:hypothetical protein